MRIGIDIGGTFTDCAALSEDGALHTFKLLSSPADPSVSMLAGIAHLTAEHAAAPRAILHGSTVATNAILERKLARAALITTGGFRDLLLIGRQNRPNLYALHPTIPAPAIPREHCWEVPERLDHTGRVLIPLDEAALQGVIDALIAAEIEAVAVCLLHSTVNPAHEQRIAEALRARGFADWQIALSSEVMPEFREYERASTTALEAGLRPIMDRYLRRLEAKLPVDTPFRMMKSDGGVMDAPAVRARAIQTALSGPAAGVIGAFALAQAAGFERIITFDMGGTSTDVALCDGAPSFRSEAEIGGLPLRARLLDIETIGAGGGSLARLDAGGALRVGPESAGAAPGPIVYGRGGTRLTVSDANALLGRLDADHFLGGQMRLDLAPAAAALDALAAAMGVSAEDAARGIIAVADSSIERALRRVSVARGHDPREYALVAFGGAGPLHACAVADRLEMRRVIIPRYPGVLCALGLLSADFALDFGESLLGIYTDKTAADLTTRATRLIDSGRTALAARGFTPDQMVFQVEVAMRYAGQAYELATLFAVDQPGAMLERFHAAHERAYGHRFADRTVEMVSLRVRAVGVTPDKLSAMRTSGGAKLPGGASVSGGVERARIGEKTAGGMRLALYDRERLQPGDRIDAPALIFQMDSTTYLAPGWSAAVDAAGNLVLASARW